MLKETLDQIHTLQISYNQSPTCVKIGFEVDYEDFYGPPTTNFVATVEDLTEALDYASEEHVDMDNEAYYPTPVNTGQWTATSTYNFKR